MSGDWSQPVGSQICPTMQKSGSFEWNVNFLVFKRWLVCCSIFIFSAVWDTCADSLSPRRAIAASALSACPDSPPNLYGFGFHLISLMCLSTSSGKNTGFMGICMFSYFLMEAQKAWLVSRQVASRKASLCEARKVSIETRCQTKFVSRRLQHKFTFRMHTYMHILRLKGRSVLTQKYFSESEFTETLYRWSEKKKTDRRTSWWLEIRLFIFPWGINKENRCLERHFNANTHASTRMHPTFTYTFGLPIVRRPDVGQPPCQFFMTPPRSGRYRLEIPKLGCQ